MLGFFFFEVLGSVANFMCAVFGAYPSIDLGVGFLLLIEKTRIQGEIKTRETTREGNEKKGDALKQKAKDSLG